MGIRIECDTEGFRGAWIEFRERGWRFGDRMEILNTTSDLKVLQIIVKYIEDWNLSDVDGHSVVFDKAKSVEQVYDLDELLISWLIAAWFEARHKLTRIPLANSSS